MKKTYNPKLDKLVQILNDGQYHNGDALGEMLGMTRSAVWKSIKSLQEEGVKIDSVKGKGYAMLQPLILLSEDKIKQSTSNIDLVLLKSINSTNTFLKNMDFRKTTVCVAEKQTGGRGRFDRSWHSPFAENLYMSYGFYFQGDISELAGLSLVSSLALVKVLNQYIRTSKAEVKWPNDILYQGKKMSGSLIEVDAQSHHASRVIIGMGVNVNMLDFINEWTSLRVVMGEYLDRNVLLVKIIDSLQQYIAQFLESGFGAFVAEWNANDYLKNKMVTIDNVGKLVSGVVKGVNESGYLMLQLSTGEIRAYSAGDATLVKK